VTRPLIPHQLQPRIVALALHLQRRLATQQHSPKEGDAVSMPADNSDNDSIADSQPSWTPAAPCCAAGAKESAYDRTQRTQTAAQAKHKN